MQDAEHVAAAGMRHANDEAGAARRTQKARGGGHGLLRNSSVRISQVKG